MAGIFDTGGTTLLTNCTVSSNTSSGYGFSSEGGGLLLRDLTTSLTNCAITGNSSLGSGSIGGGLAIQSGTTMVTNCTISGNSATGSGGGLANDDGNTLTLTNTTVSGNSASTGGGLRNNYGGVATLGNTIIAGNTAGTGPDVDGGVTSLGHNLIGKTNGSSGWVVGSDLTGTIATPLNPLLGHLGDNGGPTQTMALLPGSPAIGQGTAVAGVTTDQRGLIRGSLVDIGAFQTSLVVESTLGTVVTSPIADLTLPGAVSLSDEFAGSTITFDPAVFTSNQTITLIGTQVELSNTALTTTITGPAAGVTVSGGGLQLGVPG